MKKRISALVMVILLSLCLGTMFVSAAEVTPRGRTCTCGGGLYPKSTSYSAWATYGSVKCEKNNNYYDSKQKRSVYTTYRCNRCGYEVTLTTTQYRTLCTH